MCDDQQLQILYKDKYIFVAILNEDRKKWLNDLSDDKIKPTLIALCNSFNEYDDAGQII